MSTCGRKLEGETTPGVVAAPTSADWARSAAAVGDVADPAIMADAWQ